MREPSQSTASERLNELVIVCDAFQTHFTENTPEERKTFVEAWRTDLARKHRDELEIGLAEGASDIRFVLWRVEEARNSAWPWEIFREKPGSHDARFAGDYLQILGTILLGWFEKGDSRPMRLLADLIDGKKTLASRSAWKEVILSECVRLCKKSGFRRLPTKRELSDAVLAWPSAGAGIDEKRLREYRDALGLSGLPSARRGRKAK